MEKKNWWNTYIGNIPMKTLGVLISVIMVCALITFLITYKKPLGNKDIAKVTYDIEAVDSGKVSNVTFGTVAEIKRDSQVVTYQAVYYTLFKDSTESRKFKFAKIKNGFLKYKYEGLLKY